MLLVQLLPPADIVLGVQAGERKTGGGPMLAFPCDSKWMQCDGRGTVAGRIPHLKGTYPALLMSVARMVTVDEIVRCNRRQDQRREKKQEVWLPVRMLMTAVPMTILASGGKFLGTTFDMQNIVGRRQ